MKVLYYSSQSQSSTCITNGKYLRESIVAVLTPKLGICRVQWVCLLFLVLILNTFGPKIQNCLFKAKFDISTNSNIQNSMVVCHYICFRLKIPFLGKFGPKNENCQFQLKFGTSSNSSMKNSIVIFTLSVFERKYPFYGKFVSKNQNYLLKLKFGTYTTSICRIRW